MAGALIGVTACGLQWGIEHGVAARNSALQHASVHNGALGVFVAKIFLSTCLTAVAGVLVLLFAPLAAGGGVSVSWRLGPYARCAADAAAAATPLLLAAAACFQVVPCCSLR